MIHAGNFPMVSGLRPDRFTPTETLNAAEHFAIKKITDAVGREPVRLILGNLPYTRVSPEAEVGLRVCEILWDDRHDDLQRRRVADMIRELLPAIPWHKNHPHPRHLPKMRSLSMQKLKRFTTALVDWCFDEERASFVEELANFVRGLLEKAKDLEQYGFVRCSLRDVHPFFDEMWWARNIENHTHEEVAVLATIEKYYGEQQTEAYVSMQRYLNINLDNYGYGPHEIALHTSMAAHAVAMLAGKDAREREHNRTLRGLSAYVREKYPFEAKPGYLFH